MCTRSPLTFARQLNNNMSLEFGYIGRIIKNEYMGMNLNAVPYMMTKGGQTFANAYANAVIGYCGSGNVKAMGGGNCNGNTAAVAPQPFFETALAGTGYCNGFANCTQAVLANEGNNGTGNLAIQNVWSLYSDLDKVGSRLQLPTQHDEHSTARPVRRSRASSPAASA